MGRHPSAPESLPEFHNTPSRIQIADEKKVRAADRVEQDGLFREASIRMRMNGIPHPPHDYRPDDAEDSAWRQDQRPPYKSWNLGWHWPKHEPRPISGLYDSAPPPRLAATENMHPASRLRWLA